MATGDTVSGTLESAGRESDLFRFDATEGQELFFDAQSSNGGTAYWSLIGPDGSTHFGPQSFDPSLDPARIVVPVTGTYTLMLEGYVHNSADKTYRFSINEVTDVVRAVTTDAPVMGRIDVPGQRHKLTFTLDAPGMVWLDSLSPSDLSFRLDGPRGEELNWREFRYGDWQYNNPVLPLVAGDYTLTIEGGSGRTGNYALQLLTRASAQELERGVQVSAQLGDRGVSKEECRVPSAAPLTGGAGQAQAFGYNSPKVTLGYSAAIAALAVTFETWIKADDPPSFQVVAAKNRPGEWGGGYGFWMNGGEVRFYVNDLFADAMTAGEWTHDAWHGGGRRVDAVECHCDVAL